MRTKRIFLSLFLFACALATPAFAQGVSSQPITNPTFAPPAQSFTATAQTGATYVLGGFGSGTIAVTGTITTVTFAAQGTTDGVHFFPLLTAAIAVPGTTATTETATANSLYIVNVAGLTGIRFVTSSTFTGTGVTFKFTATSNRGLL
jgi:hypothetical protein